MRSEGNHLFFQGDLGRDPLPATAALHSLITKLGYQDVILDFRQSARIFPEFMIPIVTICRSYRRDKIDFQVLLPDDRKIANYLSNTNWAHLISPERFEAKDANCSPSAPMAQI